MPVASAPRAGTRWALRCLALLAWAVFGYLALHRSDGPVVLGRYSAAYAKVLAGALAVCGAATLANGRWFLVRIDAWRRELLLVLASVVMALLSAEGFLRVFDPVGLAYYSEMRLYEQDRVPDPVLSYRHPRSTTRRYQGVEFRFNEAGLRDDPIAPKAEDEFRVVVLGDSVALGWGVEQEKTFSAVLQRTLAAELGRPVRVINTGVCSYNTVIQLAWLREHGFALDPDLVLLVYVSNDVLPTESIWAPEGSRRQDRRLADFVIPTLFRSWLYRLLLHVTQVQAWQVVPVHSGEPGWQASMAALQELVADAQARDVKLAFFFWSWLVDANHGALLAAARSAVAPIAFDDIGSWFVGQPIGRLMNSRIDPHPNAQAHALLAERMLASLRAQQQLPDASPLAASRAR